MCKDTGFTLIEALVALVILALTAVTLLGMAETHVVRIDGLESRAIAQWIAENRLVELQIGDTAGHDRPETMLERDWQVNVSMEATADPALSAIKIQVVEAGTEQPQVIFGSFLDRGAISP